MELDDAYANAPYIVGADGFIARWKADAAAFRSGVSGQLNLPYGTGEREQFDLFLPEGAAARGLLVFVHGGYWLKFDRSYWSHLAAGALAQGWAVAMPSYDLCPTVHISEITQQIARAVEAAAAMVPGPVSVAGHSAGGHLVARMLAPGMMSADVMARLHHVVPISPLSDLRPLLQTSMNGDLRLNPAEAEAESPINQPRPEVEVTVWVGADERPAFLDQAQWLVDAWGCGQVVAPGRHHFDVVEALADANSDLVRRLTA